MTLATATDDQAPAHPGRTELGKVTLQDRVVIKIAARAVTEVPDAGAAAPRILGRTVGAAVPGIRQSSLSEQPKVAVDVDLSVASITLSISVRWPASIPEVTAAVREHVIARVTEMTGLRIIDIRIEVADLVTHLDQPPRVR